MKLIHVLCFACFIHCATVVWSVTITPQQGSSDKKLHRTKAGSDVKLECVSDEADNVEWQYKGMKITQSDRIKIHISSDKKKNHLMISAVTKSDAGQYSCVVDPLTKDMVKLEVTEDVQLKISPSDHHLKANDNGKVNLTCEGGLETKITWFKDGEALHDGSGYVINEKLESDKKISMFTISMFKPDKDAGHYCCYDTKMKEDGSSIVHVDLANKHAGGSHKEMSKERCKGDKTSASEKLYFHGIILVLLPILAVLYR